MDIGSNDGTLLGFYPDIVRRMGFDPLADKYADFYAPGVLRCSDFFTPSLGIATVGRGQAKIVTTIACFYDIPDPVGFARAVWAILDEGGIWVVEMATVDDILGGAWDQICHEHTEYYGINQIADIIERAGLRTIGATPNDVNGGSIQFVFQKGGHHQAITIGRAHKERDWTGLASRIDKQCQQLRDYLVEQRANKKVIYGYGASTKGNVILQRAGIGPDLLPIIYDASAEKNGKVTPGTGIRIETMQAALEAGPLTSLTVSPDAMLVLPWHFREFVINKERAFLEGGGELVFALPDLEIVSSAGVRRAA